MGLSFPRNENKVTSFQSDSRGSQPPRAVRALSESGQACSSLFQRSPSLFQSSPSLSELVLTRENGPEGVREWPRQTPHQAPPLPHNQVCGYPAAGPNFIL